jgi:hypothetical protein
MKYYITTTFEMDGHSSAMSIICDSGAAKQKYLQEVLYDPEGQKYYPTSTTNQEEDGSTTMYGTWDCGEWSINILPFKTFKEICNKERFTRTG